MGKLFPMVCLGSRSATSAGLASGLARPSLTRTPGSSHPKEAKSLTPEVLTRLEELLKSGRAVAVGECGLDYSTRCELLDSRGLAIQERALVAQVDLALRCVGHRGAIT